MLWNASLAGLCDIWLLAPRPLLFMTSAAKCGGSHQISGERQLDLRLLLVQAGTPVTTAMQDPSCKGTPFGQQLFSAYLPLEVAGTFTRKMLEESLGIRQSIRTVIQAPYTQGP